MARIGERQRGCVHREQLRLAGLGRHAIAHRRHNRTLHPLFPEVYLVGRPRLEPLGLETAAIMYVAGYGVLSGLTAAVKVWEASDADVEEVTLTVVGRDIRSSERLHIYRPGSLAREDIRRRKGLPVTSPARTVVDCAGLMTPLALEALVADLRHRGLVTEEEMLAALDRAPRAKGAATLRRLIREPGRLTRTRSSCERRLLELVVEAQLPRPLVNAKLDGLEVDFVWPQARLVVELDGYAFHGSRGAFERDRSRDRRLSLLGYHVLRVTAAQLDRAPFAVIAAIASLLATRGTQAA